MAPTTLPLLLGSEFALATGLQNAVDGRLRRVFIAASEYLNRTCRRRFDECRETRYYTCRYQRDEGDLITPYDLELNADLKTLITLTNADSQVISPSVITLLPKHSIGSGINIKNRIHLNQMSGVFFRAYGHDPTAQISVDGTWGYGGQWVDLTTLAGQQAATGRTLTLTSLVGLEEGMMLKIGDEYEYVDAVGASNATVTRAYNGTTAAIHADLAPVSYFEPLPLVRDLVLRLSQWKLEQNKSPLAQSIGVGDDSFPASTEGLPDDLSLAIKDSGLRRSVPWAMGV